MTRSQRNPEIKELSRWVRESESWFARRFRRWAVGRDLDKWIRYLGFTIGLGLWVLVLLLIGVAEAVHVPSQVGLP